MAKDRFEPTLAAYRRRGIAKLSPNEYLHYLQLEAKPLDRRRPGLQGQIWKELFPDEYEGIVAAANAKMRQDRVLGRLVKIRHRFAARKPTPAQGGFGIVTMRALAVRVKNGARRLGYHLPEQMTLGTLPWGDINAHTLAVPGGGWAIALNEGTFTFSLLAAKIVASTMDVVQHGGRGREKLTPGDLVGARKRLAQLIFYYRFFGDAWFAPPYGFQGPGGAMIGILLEGMETFIVGHEYGHAVLGHLKSADLVSRHFNYVDLDEVVYDPEQEYDADWFSARVLLSIRERFAVDDGLRYVGAEVFLAFSDIMEDEGILAPSPSHPTARQRRAYLRQMLTREVAHRSVFGLGEGIQSNLAQLWKDAKPQYERMCQTYSEQMLAHLETFHQEDPAFVQLSDALKGNRGARRP